MSLLHEVALTPDVFLESGFSQSGISDLCVGMLRPILMGEAIVRDLRDGLWSRQFLDRSVPWHAAGQRLLKALAEGNRLVPASSELPGEPSEPVEWAWEAQASHKRVNLAAIISGRQIWDELDRNPPCCCVEELHESSWWNGRKSSVRLGRTAVDYLQHLDLILRWSKSVMIIDPHLDPSRRNYAEFYQILEVARRQKLAPVIELHRVCYDGSGPNRKVLTRQDFDERFGELACRLQRAGLCAEVSVWDDFHDRYLISNLIGISMPNGFDVSRDSNDRTTWTRLSSPDRDDIQREFDPAARRHQLRFRFSIGTQS